MAQNHTSFKAGLALTAVALALGAGCGRGRPTANRPVRSLAGFPSGCTAAVGAVACELWARPRTLTLPGGATAEVWTFAASAGPDAAGAPIDFPGPLLAANEGDQVTVLVHNDLPGPLGLLFKGQAMPPDLAGIPAGGSATYRFTAASPGTFLYEAGPAPGAGHQVAKGLVGPLVVRPAAGPAQAYAAAASAFDDEVLLVLTDADPAFLASPAPATYDLRTFAPTHWLINGKAYPETAVTPVAAGSRVLLRVLNGGLQHHALAVLGADQAVVGVDGLPRSYVRRVVSESLAPGQTMDAVVTVPAAAPAGTRLPVYDASLKLHNGAAPGFGGLLTFLEVAGAPAAGDLAGPAIAGLAAAPAVSDGGAPVTITATASDAATGGGNVVAAEWALDAPGAPGSGTPMTGAFGAPTAALSATVPATAFAGLPAGAHVVFVRALDAAGNWGPLNFATVTIDNAGPDTSGITLTPGQTNGPAVGVSATADDRAHGGSTVVAAEWFLDVPGAPGAGTPLTPGTAAPVVSIDGTIDAARVAALAEGVHTLHVHAQDELLQWGPFATATFVVDRTGPAASAVTVTPNPTNGVTGVNSSVPALRLTAQLDDALTSLAAAEGFIDAAGASGQGFPMLARRGLFDGPSRVAEADIPLTTVAQLSDGDHALLVHGRDAAGNWGPLASATLVVDRLPPAITGLAAAPNPTNPPGGAGTTFALSATATDATSNVVAAEWFQGTDPGQGLGTPMTLGGAPSRSRSLSATVNYVALGWTAGPRSISVRARDAAGHWSPPASVVVTIVLPNALPDALFADGFESGGTGAWSGGAIGAPAVTGAAALQGAFGLAVGLAGAGAAVSDATPAAETSYHARFYVAPGSAVSGGATVDLLVARQASGAVVFRVQYMRATTAAAATVQVVFTRAGGTTSTRAYALPAGATSVEVAWQASTSATVSLYTGGVLRQTLAGLDTSGLAVDAVQLGAQVSGAGASGSVALDSFASRRFTVIGP